MRRNQFSSCLLVMLTIGVFLFEGVFLSAIGFSAEQGALDTGFRSNPNGFSFENWGGDQYPQGKLTIEDARCLFGDRICERIKDDQCIPTPAAKLWVQEMNKGMEGGHCEGFAALSAAMFVGREDPQWYGGGSTAFALKSTDERLLRRISTYFVTQAIEPVSSITEQTRSLSLREIVETLRQAMSSGEESYTLGIYGEAGGHAITPYAIEDKGNGVYWIYVYDNNYPGAEKYVEVDTENDVWQYAGAALNPSEDPSPWKGSSGAMDLTPLSIRQEPLSCPFCADKSSHALCAENSSQPPQKPEKPSTQSPKPQPPSSPQTDSVSVFTDAKCSRLSAVDKNGKQITMDKGKMVSQIPGAKMTKLKGVFGCFMALPAGTEYNVQVIGEDGKPSQPTDLIIFRPGNVYDVSGITMKPDQQEQFKIGENLFSYVSGDQESPTITVATDNLDGADGLYVIDDFTLSEDHSFTISESDTGQLIFKDDDPELDTFDVDVTLADAEGSKELSFQDVTPGDEGETIMTFDEQGDPEVELDKNSDGTIDETEQGTEVNPEDQEPQDQEQPEEVAPEDQEPQDQEQQDNVAPEDSEQQDQDQIIEEATPEESANQDQGQEEEVNPDQGESQDQQPEQETNGDSGDE
jgi:hypothetical protein